MTPEEKQTISKLREQIERDDVHTERECAVYLKDVAWILLPTLNGTITYVNCEQLCSAGRVDMIVIAEILEPGGGMRPGAYIWELKAPQISLFDIETQNQACPSQELLKAENQLLHYYYSVANSGHLRDRWGIVSPYYVKFGGIIIGRDRAFVKCNGKDLVLGRKLAEQALRIRDSVFYRASGINVWTWDHILAILKNQTLSHQRFLGDPEVKIELRNIETESFIAGSPFQMTGQKCPGCKEGVLDVSPTEDGVFCEKCGLFLPSLKTTP